MRTWSCAAARTGPIVPAPSIESIRASAVPAPATRSASSCTTAAVSPAARADDTEGRTSVKSSALLVPHGEAVSEESEVSESMREPPECEYDSAAASAGSFKMSAAPARLPVATACRVSIIQVGKNCDSAAIMTALRTSPLLSGSASCSMSCIASMTDPVLFIPSIESMLASAPSSPAARAASSRTTAATSLAARADETERASVTSSLMPQSVDSAEESQELLSDRARPGNGGLGSGGSGGGKQLGTKYDAAPTSAVSAPRARSPVATACRVSMIHNGTSSDSAAITTAPRISPLLSGSASCNMSFAAFNTSPILFIPSIESVPCRAAFAPAQRSESSFTAAGTSRAERADDTEERKEEDVPLSDSMREPPGCRYD